MASNPQEPLTTLERIARAVDAWTLGDLTSNDAMKFIEAEINKPYAASPLPAEPPPTSQSAAPPPLNSTYCDKLLFQVAGGGELRCNAPKGHDGVCHYITRYIATDQPAPPFELGRNPNIPRTCNACGRILLLENLYVDDGCPCNSARGVNFTPQPCELCRLDCCVKPGHRLFQLFGVPATPSAAEPQKEE